MSRWALLRAYRQKCPWLDKVHFLLFAPAHSGGIVVDNISELLGANKITKVISDAAKATFPLLNELAPDEIPSPIFRQFSQHRRLLCLATHQFIDLRNSALPRFFRVAECPHDRN